MTNDTVPVGLLRQAFDAGISQAESGEGGRPPLSDDFAFELFLNDALLRRDECDPPPGCRYCGEPGGDCGFVCC